MKLAVAQLVNKIPRPKWNPTVSVSVHKCAQLVPLPSRLNPVHTALEAHISIISKTGVYKRIDSCDYVGLSPVTYPVLQNGREIGL